VLSRRAPRSHRALRGALFRAWLCAWLTGLAGCVTVRPEEREVLADPAMTFGAGGDAAAHEDHVLSNREGSIGGGASSGGGCGCN
jgi:hypothetical protein